MELKDFTLVVTCPNISLIKYHFSLKMEISVSDKLFSFMKTLSICIILHVYVFRVTIIQDHVSSSFQHFLNQLSAPATKHFSKYVILWQVRTEIKNALW